MIEQARLAFISNPEPGEYILTLQYRGQHAYEILRFQITRGQLGNIVADGAKFLVAESPADRVIAPKAATDSASGLNQPLISTTDDIQ